MSEESEPMSQDMSLKGRVTRQGEEAIGKLAQELLENAVVSGALSAAFETRERAVRAQEVAMGALNLPSASDLERLTRRVRSVSQRLEGIEDGIDRLDDRLARADGTKALEDRLAKIEATLARLEAAGAAGQPETDPTGAQPDAAAEPDPAAAVEPDPAAPDEPDPAAAAEPDPAAAAEPAAGEPEREPPGA
jgi:hypothetical protein